ncbi:hypothetical protein D3C87_1832200 [compost metagenome]
MTSSMGSDVSNDPVPAGAPRRRALDVHSFCDRKDAPAYRNGRSIAPFFSSARPPNSIMGDTPRMNWSLPSTDSASGLEPDSLYPGMRL